MPPPHIPNRPQLHSGSRPRVIQGYFPGNRPRFPVRPAPGGIVQLATRGPAIQLPPALLDLRPPGMSQRLPEMIQRRMEALFGSDFSQVRVHVGHEASVIGALAFTCGPDLYFAQGQYNLNSPHGLRLIGHELTHVLQQRDGRVQNPFGSGVAVVQDLGLEAEAERMAIRVGQPSIQRREAPQGLLTLARNEDFQARLHQLKARYRNPLAPLPGSRAPVGSLQLKPATSSQSDVPAPLRFPPRNLAGLIQRYQESDRSLGELEDERAVRKRLTSGNPKTTSNYASIIFKVHGQGDEVDGVSQGPDLVEPAYHGERMAIMKMCTKIGVHYIPENPVQTRKNLDAKGLTEIYIFTEWQPCPSCHDWLSKFLRQDEILYYAEGLEYRENSKGQRAINFQVYLADLVKASSSWEDYEF